jgi:hypothetical protein
MRKPNKYLHQKWIIVLSNTASASTTSTSNHNHCDQVDNENFDVFGGDEHDELPADKTV